MEIFEWERARKCKIVWEGKEAKLKLLACTFAEPDAFLDGKGTIRDSCHSYIWNDRFDIIEGRN